MSARATEKAAPKSAADDETTAPPVIERVRHENIHAALAAFQAEVPRVEKGATAKVETAKGGYSYQYADLAVVTAVAMPLLGKHGLAFTARPTMIGDRFALLYALVFEGDTEQAIEGEYPLPNPMGMKAQEVGSAITYARRYAFCSVTGVAPGGDDDDAASSNDKLADGRRGAAQGGDPAPEPAALGDGLEHRAPTQDWLVDARGARSVAELRPVFEAAQAAGDLNVAIRQGEEFVALGAVLQGMKAGLPEVAPEDESQVTPDAWAPAGDAPAAEPAAAEGDASTMDWPTADIPKD